MFICIFFMLFACFAYFGFLCVFWVFISERPNPVFTEPNRSRRIRSYDTEYSAPNIRYTKPHARKIVLPCFWSGSNNKHFHSLLSSNFALHFSCKKILCVFVSWGTISWFIFHPPGGFWVSYSVLRFGRAFCRRVPRSRTRIYSA